MKITSVKAVPASSSPQGRPPRNYMFVKVETDEGVTGWGEATAGPLSVATQIDEVGQVLVGEDPGDGPAPVVRDQDHGLVAEGGDEVGAAAIGSGDGLEIALLGVGGERDRGINRTPATSKGVPASAEV